MKRMCVFFLLAILTLSCSKNGEQVAPPSGMDAAIKDYFTKPNQTLHGYNVRAYPNNVYLVSADCSFGQNREVLPLVAEKATSTDGKEYWQVSYAEKDKLKLLGIKSE